MADETFNGVCFAIGTQSAFGTPNSTIAALSGTIDETDGCVLGDKASGDADSGITIPTIAPTYREVAPVTGSFTESADSFQKALVNGLTITLPLQGNGATATTPAAGEAIPDVGIRAIWQSMGMVGANGSAPAYAYTPSTGTTYTTIKLWLADLSYVFTDCIVDSASMVFTPGGNGLLTANIKVGTHDPSSDFADGVTFPTVTYGTQASLSAPTVAGVNFTWGQVRGFETLTINVANSIEEFGDSNVTTTGVRQSQTRRLITVDGTLYLATADSDFEYQNAISSSAPTTDLSFQVGTACTTTGETINAYKVEVNNLQAQSIKHNRIGTVASVELSGAKATATSAGGEFTFTFN